MAKKKGKHKKDTDLKGPLQLSDQVEQDLEMVFSFLCLLSWIEAEEIINPGVFPLLMDARERVGRAKENADKIWQMLRVKILTEQGNAHLI